MFLNIILNASSAIKKNTSVEKGIISLSTSEDEEYIIIVVSDNGCGFTKDGLSTLFEPFHTTFGGSGLGLYVSKKIIVEHGGIIEVENNSSQAGAKCVIKLPKKSGRE